MSKAKETRNGSSTKTKVMGLWTDWNRKGALGKYGGVGWYRIINPLSKIENTTVISGQEIEIGGDNRVEVAQRMKDMGDVWFIKYIDDHEGVSHILAARDMASQFISPTKVVVDLDDDPFNIHPHNYAYQYHYPGSPKNEALKFLIKSADHVVVSTKPLKDAILPYNKNITVIPNCIDPDIWNVPIKRNDSDKIRLGWILSANHEQDIPAILPALKKILKKYPHVEFWHIGYDSEEFDSLPENQHKVIHGTKGYEEYPAFVAGLGLDISIAPIIDDKFNVSKSNIKWMEASMCEVPTVASNVYPYQHSIRHGKDGFLAETTEDWVKHLSQLIESKELRTEMGRKAKESVLKRFNINDHLISYNNFFTNIWKK